jgi:hypothetical protein
MPTGGTRRRDPRPRTRKGHGSVVILPLVFGPTLLSLAPLVALVGWAGMEVGDHTPAQVVTN